MSTPDEIRNFVAFALLSEQKPGLFAAAENFTLTMQLWGSITVDQKTAKYEVLKACNIK